MQGGHCAEMEFLDISLIKDSRLLLHATVFTVSSTGGFKEKHTLLWFYKSLENNL
jgi:hypothetical protein